MARCLYTVFPRHETHDRFRNQVYCNSGNTHKCHFESSHHYNEFRTFALTHHYSPYLTGPRVFSLCCGTFRFKTPTAYLKQIFAGLSTTSLTALPRRSTLLPCVVSCLYFLTDLWRERKNAKEACWNDHAKSESPATLFVHSEYIFTAASRSEVVDRLLMKLSDCVTLYIQDVKSSKMMEIGIRMVNQSGR